MTVSQKLKSPNQTNKSSKMKRTALIIVDPQFDFGDPRGALYVPKGETVVSIINALRAYLNTRDVFISQDNHPADHVSFAANNPPAALFSSITLPDGTNQVMWPVHCVRGSHGSWFLDGLTIEDTDIIIPKGQRQDTDSYSAFGSACGQKEVTPLLAHLQERGITHVVVAGLALDYCVSYTAKDAAKFGFKTCVVLSASMGVAKDSTDKELVLMAEAGVTLADDISAALKFVVQ